MPKPTCECWLTSEESEGAREQLVNMIGLGMTETFQQNCQFWNFCAPSLPYAAGAAIVGLAGTIAINLMPADTVRQPTETEILEMIDRLADEAKERVRALGTDLAFMDVKGRG